jgi:hypothetical protein
MTVRDKFKAMLADEVDDNQDLELRATLEMVAAEFAQHWMDPASTLDVFDYAAGYFTGAMWGFFLDGLYTREPEDRAGVLTTYAQKYPAYLLAYQAGQLTREIIIAHGRIVR